MPIRLLAVDLDGTLLDSRGNISRGNLEALESVRGQGVHVVIVTGRRFHSALPLLNAISRPLTVISSNGARIGAASGEVYRRNFLPQRVAQQVIEAAPDYLQYAVAIFDMPGRGQLLMHTGAAMDGPAGWYLRNSPECLVQTPELAASIAQDPVQVMFGGPPETIHPVEAKLRSAPVASCCHLTWTKYLTRNLSILDVLNNGCSKGSALAWWAERCGISPDEVMAIGDNLNDIEMLQFAGLPILMGNHNHHQIPDGWHVTFSNDEDGVAAALRRYVL